MPISNDCLFWLFSFASCILVEFHCELVSSYGFLAHCEWSGARVMYLFHLYHILIAINMHSLLFVTSISQHLQW